MWRSIHSWVGLVLALLVMIMSVTGTILATQPIYESYQVKGNYDALTVAEVIKRIAQKNPRIDPQKLSRSPSGEYTLSYSRRGNVNQRAVDLETGKLVRAIREPELYVFVKKLHRSFLLGEKGRLISAAGGIAMAVLLLSGTMLLVRRLGGWKQLLSHISWRGAANQHAQIGRYLLLPLLLTTLTALWLSAVTFHLISSGSDTPPKTVESLKELKAVEPWTLHALQDIQMKDVQAVIYPIPDDWTDSWAVQTHSSTVSIDQFTGDVIYRDSTPVLAQIMHWVRFLHTAEGSSVWAIILLISSLSVPFFAFTGAWIWWRNKRQGKGRIKHNAPSAKADTLVLVGSETGSTWGFAKALHQGLHQAGHAVRLIDMNALGKHYPKLRTMIVMTATYGDGDAPKSATRFLAKLERFTATTDIQYLTLAFGDKAFPAYCAYGEQVNAALQQKLGEPILSLVKVDKQSAQTFEHWCGELAKTLQCELDVRYEPKRPKTHELVLHSKQLYAQDSDAVIAVLRFSANKLPKHHAGDLVAIYPPESVVPRLYSLGSDSKKDGFLEICVRRQAGGLCSTWLCALEQGAAIAVNILPNPRFRLPASTSPVIFVGAGTGIAPFTGMIRHNHNQREMALFWGGRNPATDALYATEIEEWLHDNKLTTFSPAWSRIGEKQYVQDQIKQARERLKQSIQQGAIIMVCGGRAMAEAVWQEFEVIAQEIGTSVAELKRKHRYMEDVY